ncbi:winged helix-turn-helix domain-containing protein [uncultured Sphingomonas sp.]|uniref:winged helix-turn-helix domain-containing protein n=2 Tax=Sphingomonas TaxID=13687 RepID=UPI0035CB83F7
MAMGDKHYALDAYVLDTLMRDLVGHDRRASAFLVYIAFSAASAMGSPRLSHAQLAERTGLSKRSVQDAVRHLAGRKLLRATRGGKTDVTHYEVLAPWRRPSDERTA